MIRILAALATLGALAVAALGGQALFEALEDPLPPAPATGPGTLAATDPAPPRSAPQPPPSWPALFGEPRPPEPQPPAAPAPDPQPPAPPAPPLESLGYSLKGVVSDGDSRWAIVAHPTGDQLLRVGDRLGPSHRVAAIDEAGLWLETAPGSDRRLLGFSN